MTVYELRIWPNPHSRAERPLRTETFEAATNTEAIDRLHDFAETLPRTESVFLWASGGGRSIASDEGRA